MNRGIANLMVLAALAASTTPAAAEPSREESPPRCKFENNKLTLLTAETVNLIATLANPPRTRVVLSINGGGGFHRELVWDPAVGDGLQHDLLLRKGDGPYTVMAFADDDRLQTSQVVVVTATRFKTCAQPTGAKSSQPCPPSLEADEAMIYSATKTTTVVAGVGKPDVDHGKPDDETPRLKLKCDIGAMELSKLHLNRKELFAASVARGFLDQAAPTAVTDALALVAEIAVERAKAGALEIVKQRFVDPMCRSLNLRLLGLGSDDRAFPRTCAMLSNMRLEDLLSSGRSLVDAARDDVRLHLLPRLVTKANLPSAARDLAALALRLGNEMLDGGGTDVADLDLLVTQLDRIFFQGAVASYKSFKSRFIDHVMRKITSAETKKQLIQHALDRALPDDPGALISEYVEKTEKETRLAEALSLATTTDCHRLKDNERRYIAADRPACVGALTNQLATGNWTGILSAILSLDELVGLVSAASRAEGGLDFETWIANESRMLLRPEIETYYKTIVPEELKRSCAVRVTIAVVKWCSRRDSCTASDIATAIDAPHTLFKVPTQDDSPDWLCWTRDKQKLELPTVRTVYVELASRALAFLTPPPKGDERKRVQAVLRWMFDLARSLEIEGSGAALQRLEEIVELFDQRDYLRAISQTLALAIESRGCADTKCSVPDELKKAMSLFSAVTSYLRVHAETAALDPAEAKAARKKAIESLIDGATDRRQRDGDWIVSLGVPVGLSVGSRWTPGTSAAGYKSAAFSEAYERERTFTWRLPLGLAVQRLHSAGSWPVGFHAGLTFADLGNFARGRANGDDDEIQWKDFLQIGGQVGALFGNRRHSVLLAVDVSWSPGLYEREVDILTDGDPVSKTLSGSLMAGITLAYYVPIFDLN